MPEPLAITRAPSTRFEDSDIVMLAFWILLALLAIVVIVAGPVLTSDGPAHVSMAPFIVRGGDPAWPMLNRLYEFNLIEANNCDGSDVASD